MKAICIIKGQNIKGIVKFEQKSKNQQTIIKILVYGLPPGLHGFHIHEYGDQTNGCISMGGHYNPFGKTHSDINSSNRHVGDLGNIKANKKGVAFSRIIDNQISLFGQYNIIGRGMVIHEKEDDLGKGGNEESLKTGNAGRRIACGIIARTHN